MIWSNHGWLGHAREIFNQINTTLLWKMFNIIARILYNKTKRILFLYCALLCICLNSLWIALFNGQCFFFFILVIELYLFSILSLLIMLVIFYVLRYSFLCIFFPNSECLMKFQNWIRVQFNKILFKFIVWKTIIRRKLKKQKKKESISFLHEKNHFCP